ncbi:hypothetical protein DH2020_000136 [Rehmannia glutinosa]|uniref:Thioredoxin domain-containing protein n=1 Tax=Rehmannia glutinosa TaxID=99300 RepID=A0ABR0XVL7_REHGL
MRHRFPTPSVAVLLLFLSSIVLLSSISISFVEAEVITLTSDTFNDKVQEKDTAWFVKFCVPWCKHCKNLGTLWEDLGKEMEGEDEIEIGEVDCATDKSVCSKVDIHSYPTFKLFYNGEEVTKYYVVKFEKLHHELSSLDSSPLVSSFDVDLGARDVESLKTFVLQETEKAATKAQLDNDGEFFREFLLDRLHLQQLKLVAVL